ncbi:MAG: hypothetical protein MMC23_005362 [Stictis urceolatum]|nr:hypothetical protein [Stictis urceolata]
MPTDNSDSLQSHLDRLLATRPHPKTICPSEVPRALTSTELNNQNASNWRDLMPMVRDLLQSMRERGEVEILQKGSVVSNDIPVQDIKGPIRARKAASTNIDEEVESHE